ncbi:MAG: PASTA domain-containing protein, partial [Oscillospiraceae bacterium]|nr:PASTA domain-containing protein [Oscillospiraceae bacterium]
DFCIAAVRTNKEELSSELFKGYAAPEQYSPAIWQGTWTDVYGISSVLYRILTGCMPTEALLRNEADDLTPPASLNVDIPDNVSEAIIGGMRMAGEDRIQTVNELTALAFRPADDDMEKTTVNIGNIASQNAREAIQKQRSLETAAEKAPEYTDRSDRSDRYDAPPQRERMIRPAPEPEEFEDEYAIIEKVRPIIFVLILVVIVGAIILFFVKQIGVVGKSKNNGIETNIASVTTEAETEPPVTDVPVEESNGFYIQDVVPATLAPVTVAETVSSQTGMTEFTTGGNAEQNIQMINFIGKNYDDVKLSSLVQDLNIIVQYTAAEGKQKGEIIDQSIKEGTWISSGVDVILTVVGDGTDAPLTTLESGGTVVTNSNVVKGVVPNIKTPEGVSQKLNDYIALLDAAGIPYKAVPVSNPDAYPSKGYVVSVDPGVGSSVTGIVEVIYTPDGEHSSTFYSSGQ